MGERGPADGGAGGGEQGNVKIQDPTPKPIPVDGEELGLFEDSVRGFLLLVGGTADEIDLIPFSSA